MGGPLRLLRPVPVYLLITGSLENADTNIMAASWVVPVSRRPARVGVVVEKANYSLVLARRYGWLVLGIPGIEHAELVKYAGTWSRREADKVAVTGLELEPWRGDPRVPVPRGLYGWLVLRVRREHDLGPSVMFECDIIDYSAREDLYDPATGWRLERARILLHKAKHEFTYPSPNTRRVVRTRWGIAVKRPWRKDYQG